MDTAPTTPNLSAGLLNFVVRHELWDGNVQDHADQGISLDVTADVDGKPTALLRFHCMDFERSYIYGPENANMTLQGPMMLGPRTRGRPTTGQLYRMDPIADGNPIGWTMRMLGTKLPQMLESAGYPQIAAAIDMAEVKRVMQAVEAPARKV